MDKNNIHPCFVCGTKYKVKEIITIINGKKNIVYLCQNCINVFIISDQLRHVLHSHDDSVEHRNNSDIVCDKCGRSWNSFIKDGTLGCNKCYDIFTHEIEEYLTSKFNIDSKKIIFIHKTDTRSINISNMKLQLKQAIAEENFELAAILRDRIAMEEGSKNE